MVDTSTEAVTKLLDGVTPGPWDAESGHVQQNGQLYWQVTDKNDAIMQNQFCWCQGDHAANAHFIAAARDLIPALLAERDALRRENENLRQIERNVQAVREHEYKRAEAALAEVERLKAHSTTARPKSWRAANGDIIPLDQMTKEQAVDRLLYSAECHRRSLAEERERYEALEAKLRSAKKAKALANNRADQAWNMVRAITGKAHSMQPEPIREITDADMANIVAHLSYELAALRAIAESNA